MDKLEGDKLAGDKLEGDKMTCHHESNAVTYCVQWIDSVNIT